MGDPVEFEAMCKNDTEFTHLCRGFEDPKAFCQDPVKLCKWYHKRYQCKKDSSEDGPVDYSQAIKFTITTSQGKFIGSTLHDTEGWEETILPPGTQLRVRKWIKSTSSEEFNECFLEDL